MRRFLHLVLVATLVLTASLWLLPVDSAPSAHALFHQDPNPGSGDGGTCSSPTYCEQEACGCSAPPSNCVLIFSCSCSSIQCTRSCDYECA